MHRHNLDLIAEYAQGSLSDDSKARALIESCETCRTEYVTQTSAMNSLAGIGSARLTEHEVSTLHRELWTELRTPASPPTSVAGNWWPKLAFSAAAVAVVAVGLAGVLTNLGGADTAEPFAEIGSGLDGGGEQSGTASDETTDQAASKTTTAAESALQARSFLTDEDFAMIADQARVQTESDSYDDSEEGDLEGQAAPPDSDSDCLARAELEDFSIVTGFEDRTELIIAIRAESDLDPLPVAFIDRESCIVIHLED